MEIGELEDRSENKTSLIQRWRAKLNTNSNALLTIYKDNTLLVSTRTHINCSADTLI